MSRARLSPRTWLLAAALLAVVSAIAVLPLSRSPFSADPAAAQGPPTATQLRIVGPAETNLRALLTSRRPNPNRPWGDIGTRAWQAHPLGGQVGYHMSRFDEGDTFDLIFELNTTERDLWGIPTKGVRDAPVTVTLNIWGNYGGVLEVVSDKPITIPAGSESITARVTIQDDAVYRYDHVNWYTISMRPTAGLTLYPRRTSLSQGSWQDQGHTGIRIGIKDNDPRPARPSWQNFAGSSNMSMQQAAPAGKVMEGKSTETPDTDTSSDTDTPSDPDVIQIILRPPTNAAPTVGGAISDTFILNESGSRQVSLSGVFNDTDGDDLTVTAKSSDATVATVSVAKDYSSLTVSAQNRGTATVTVTADDGNGGTVEDTFKVTVRAAPVVASAIADVSELKIEAIHDVSLSGVFSDADGDALTVRASSSNESIATVAVAADQSKLTLTGKRMGTAVITVTAEDSDGNSVTDAFDVDVTVVNSPPTVSAGISDATISSESGASQASLSGVFADADGHDLTVTASSSDDSVATVSVSADHSTLTVTAKARGTATVTVTASDGYGGSVEDSFTVTVKAAPVVASPIGDVSGLEAEDSRTISMSGVFSDADGDAVTVTDATSSDSAVAAVLAVIDGFTSAITAVTVIARSEGTATITVAAQDADGNTVQDAFDVTVPAAEEQQQQAPELPGPVVGLELTATHDSVSVSWSAPESGDAPDGYIVNIKRQGGGDGETRRPGANKTALTFRDLNSGSTYEVWVRAQNEAGKGERVKASVTLPSVLPGPVTGLEVTATGDGVTVSWSAPESGGAPDGYIVHIRPEGGAEGSGRTKTPKAKKTKVTFENLEAGRTYEVWVRAQNEAGKGERVKASITIPVAQ